MPDNNINVQNNYLTYQYIVDIFKTLQENTIQLQSFLCGPMEDIDISKMGIEKYPILYLEPTGRVKFRDSRKQRRLFWS